MNEHPQGAAPLAPREASLPVWLDRRYRIEGEIGRGGMGRVFAARDTKLDRRVAVKMVRAERSDPAQLAQLAREAHTAGSLAHPNIVAIHDLGTFEGQPYVVEELLRGETLRHRLRQGALAPDRALDLAVQLARGLAAAHKEGIVHRDVKPENVFVTADGALKILDFGIAVLQPPAQGPQTWSGSDGTASIAGTPAYMSPEQIFGRAATPQSDLFSLGAVLYEMLGGQAAFERGTGIISAFAVLNDAPAPLPRSVPPSLARIALRCLEKEPARRFGSARELSFELEACQRDLGRSARMRRRLTAVAGVGAVLTLAVAAWIAVGRKTAQPTLRQVTFHRGAVWGARFAPDGRTAFYALTEDAPQPVLYSTSVDRPAPQRIDAPPANLLAVSSTGELALLLRPHMARFGFNLGVLARYRPGGGAPQEILEDVERADWSPDGSGLVVVRTVAGHVRLEYPLGQVVFHTTGWISAPRFSPDGKRIAFLHHPTPLEAAGVVMVTDLRGTVRTLTPSWRNVEGLAWAKGGDELWFTAAAVDTPAANTVLRAVDLSGGQGRVLAQAGASLILQDVAADGRALLTEPLKRLGLAVLRNGQPKDLSWFDQSFLGDLSADGRRVLFTVEGTAVGNASIVYLRNTDGSDPVRLGTGYGVALSPDGRWAISLALAAGPLQPLTLLPTGPERTRTVEAGGVTATRIRWFADGKRLLVAGTEPEHGLRLYVRSLEGGPPRPISEEGVRIAGLSLSPDNRYAAAGNARGRTVLFPVEGGDPIPLPQVAADEVPVGFGEGSLLVAHLGPVRVPIHRIDLRTGARTQVATLIADVPGAFGISRASATPDGSTFAFNYINLSADLFAMEGGK